MKALKSYQKRSVCLKRSKSSFIGLKSNGIDISQENLPHLGWNNLINDRTCTFRLGMYGSRNFWQTLQLDSFVSSHFNQKAKEARTKFLLQDIRKSIFQFFRTSQEQHIFSSDLSFLTFHRRFISTRKRMAENDPKRIDGRALADKIEQEVKDGVEKLKKEHGITPGLAVVLVGERKDSQTYVKKKKESAQAAGMNFILKEIPDSISQDALLKEVKELNDRKDVHGLIVQLPLPAHIEEKVILDAVSYEKDIDGFHPLNIGALTMKGRDPSFVPCTPQACLEILDRRGVELDGKHVVVLGRSNIVGTPVAMLCLHRNATVTICHSRTKDLPAVVKQADIIIAAVGKAELVKKDWVKEGAVVIDVGMNGVPDSTRKIGYRLVGDVDYNGVKEVASAITPVPGGVGPMTVCMLLRNTLTSARRSVEKK